MGDLFYTCMLWIGLFECNVLLENPVEFRYEPEFWSCFRFRFTESGTFKNTIPVPAQPEPDFKCIRYPAGYSGSVSGLNRRERHTLKWRRKIVTCLKEKLLFFLSWNKFFIKVRYSPKNGGGKSGTMNELTQKKSIYSAKKYLHRKERQHKNGGGKLRPSWWKS